MILVGTAHVSRESVDLVRRVIEDEAPDHVCVELDAQRYEALSQKSRWENLDIRQLIRRKKLATLLANLLLASYQKRLGGQLGVAPGTELLEAVRCAEERDIAFSLVDRDVRVTMLRAWRTMSFFQKLKLSAALLGGVFSDEKISEEDLRELRKNDVLSEMMKELAQVMPTLKHVLIDERDTYLAEKIRTAPGRRIVAIVGAGHVEGILETLRSGSPSDLGPITEVPRASAAWKWVGWGIPALIVASLVWIGWTQGGAAAGENVLFWIVVNGALCSLGALIALAHPLTIATAFFAAPLTSLTPVIGAGYVTAFVQAWVRPPKVRDFQTLADDASSAGSWWSNHLLRVMLAFVFPGIGSMIGTWVAGSKIVADLF